MQIDVLAPEPHSIIRLQPGLRGGGRGGVAGGGGGHLNPQPHLLLFTLRIISSLLFFHLIVGIDG